jgi:tRNA(Ile)-lysidine synthase
VLIGVSGGPDSLACLLLLRRLAPDSGFELVAAHFDHQLRPGSASDVAVVRDLCESLGVACLTGEGDVRGAASAGKAGIEETARALRYQFLAFIAGKERADCVATGHTSDDQAETVLMRVLRGAGVRGIRGMLPASPVPGAPAQRLVRPLLVLSRAETLAICREAGITPLLDPTNLEPGPWRNRIRNQALPALRSISPGVDHSLLGLAANARELFEDVERQALSAQPLARRPEGAIFEAALLKALPGEACTLVLEREASAAGLRFEVNRERNLDLRRVLKAGTGEVRFGELEVEVSSGKVRAGLRAEAPVSLEPRILNVPGITPCAGGRLEAATRPFAGDGPMARVATGDIRGALRVRLPATGDRLRYRGLERKLSDILVNEKVPRWERRQLLAVTDAERLHAVLGPGRVLDAAPVGDGILYLRLAPLTPPPGTLGGSRSGAPPGSLPR